MTEVETGQRSTGNVVRFSDRKGFGFIKPDDGGEDLFVHHTAIKSDGSYRSLAEDDVVEFDVALSDNKYQAINVTAPGGGPIQAGNKGGDNGFVKRTGRFGGSWNKRNNGGGYSGGVGGSGIGSAGCYNCGKPGHIARDCNNRGVSDNNNGGCFKCGNSGHFARDCPRSNNCGGGVGGSSNGTCFRCGGYRHLARDCPSSGGACYNCGGYGHLARDCTSSRGTGGGRFGGSGGDISSGCFNCGKEGHFARDCPNNSN